MQRDAGVVGRLLAHGVVDNLLPPIWEDRAQDFPLAGEVLDRGRRRHLPLEVRRAAGHGLRVRRPDLGDPDARVALGRARRPARARRGFAALRVHRLPERREAGPAAAGGVRARPRRASGRAARAGRSGGARRRARRGAPRRRRRSASTTSRRTSSGSCSPTATSASACAGRRWARPRAWRSARSRSASRSSSATSAGSRSCRSRSPPRCPLDEREVETPGGDARAARRGRRAAERRWARLRGEYARREHDLDRVADRYVEAIEEMAGGSAVARRRRCSEVAQAQPSDVGISRNDPQLAEIAAQASRGRPWQLRPRRGSAGSRPPASGWPFRTTRSR